MDPTRTTVAVDWVSIYTATLDNLRRKWPHDWPGLPVVLHACVQRLWPVHPPLVSQAHHLLKAAHAMAQHMEDIAQPTDVEPHYHNRLHTADALCAACLLMQSLQTQGHQLADEWMAAVLLADCWNGGHASVNTPLMEPPPMVLPACSSVTWLASVTQPSSGVPGDVDGR
jgi:hypothetical protein